MIEIIPAILPLDYNDVIGHLEAVKSATKLVQIDICDGEFTPRKTWPFVGDRGEFKKMLDEGLPFWQELDYEVDLMVADQLNEAKQWISLGAKRIIFHWEAGGVKEAIEEIKKNFFYEKDNDVLELGVAINLETDIEELKSVIDDINFVQCMGIVQIGYQGQSFDERTFKKIEAIRKTYPQVKISVDGGVSLKNAQELAKDGAERLVIGSAIFQTEVEPIEALRKIKEVLN